jgi:protein SCO1/2
MDQIVANRIAAAVRRMPASIHALASFGATALGRISLRRARVLPAFTAIVVLAIFLVGCGAGDDQTARGGAADSHGATQDQGTTTGAREAHDVDEEHHGHNAHAHGEPLGAPTDFSLYHLDAAWTDQHGDQRALASLGGRVQVVAMLYTHCGYACPRIRLDMKRIEGELPPALRDRVGFVMVSIDPERDTPEHLRRYAESVRLDPANWTLLMAPDNTVLELAALLGVKYRRISETDFSHTDVITVLDPQGEIAHRQVGLGGAPGGTLKVIERLLKT